MARYSLKLIWFRMLMGVLMLLVLLSIDRSAWSQTFDPSDPYRLVFLDQLSAMVDSAERVSIEWAEVRARGGHSGEVDLSELRRLNLELQKELEACGTATRDGIQQIAIVLIEDSFDMPERMHQLGVIVQLFEAAYRTDIATINRLTERLDPEYLNLKDYDGDGVLSQGEALPSMLMDMGAGFLRTEGFYRSILAIGEALENKNALSEEWREVFYPRVLFFMGKIDRLRAYAEENQIDFLDDWLVTAALRADAQEEALAIQARIDEENPDNVSRILFFETPAARAAHCGNLLQSIADKEAYQSKQEADGRLSWFNSWQLLLCGKFADARRASLKAQWAKRQGNCAHQQTNIHLVDQYNAILAGVYQAATLRESGEREQAAQLLDRVVQEVRQSLFLDSFTGYSNLEIVIEDDIAIYMDRLHGPRAELSLVKGMLERGRGELATALVDFKEALRLSGIRSEDEVNASEIRGEGLDVKWLLQLTEWIEQIETGSLTKSR